jgi:hypothetical protein
MITRILRLWMLLFAGLLGSSYQAFTQSDSSAPAHLRISLLTCSPGPDLYALFGHSAIRIVDSTTYRDDVYNYGTFNFEDDGFYLKFTQGKLLYYVSKELYLNFAYTYQLEQRSITEQVLLLTDAEKKSIYRFLENNLLEENKFYRYDFFFDNCTTRLRDLLLHQKKPTPVFPAVMPVQTRFRDAIHAYLDGGKQYWSKLGIDLLLGARTDAVMTPAQQEFLPDNLLKAVDQSSVTLVQEKKVILPATIQDEPETIWTPFLVMSLLFILYVLLSLAKQSAVQQILLRFNGFLFFSVGLLGLILIFMWFGTDHLMTKNNYNLLWAWPSHLVAAFWVNQPGRGMKKYHLVHMAILSLLLATWKLLPQSLNPALIPLLLLLGYISFRRWKTTQS